MTRCDSVRERIPDLALGGIDGAERAEVLLHVHGCTRCQAILDDFSGVADLLAQLAPEAEPPAGFGRRVLDAMREGRARDWRSLRRRILVVGSAAAAAAILSIAVVRIIDADRVSDGGNVASQTVPMVGGGGLPVGRVVVSAGDPASVVVSVDYALPDGVYGLDLRSTAGTERIGTLNVTDGSGAWMGSVTIPRSGAVVAMVDDSGSPVCQAHLEST